MQLRILSCTLGMLRHITPSCVDKWDHFGWRSAELVKAWRCPESNRGPKMKTKTSTIIVDLGFSSFA